MIIQDSKKIADLADAIVARTHEVYEYDTNIQNYRHIIEISNGNWTEKLLPLRHLEPTQAAMQCDIEDLELLAELQQFDRASFLLKTEIIERTKSNGILNALNIQIDAICTPEEKEIAIQEATARLAAQNLTA